MDWSEIIAWAFSAIFTLSIILIAIVIVLENRNPTKTVTWLTVLYLLPIVGFIFYIFFGRNYRRKRRVKSKYNNNLLGDIDVIVEMQKQMLNHKETFNEERFYSKKRLINLLLKSNRAPFTFNNEAVILTNADQKFRAVFKAINEAKSHIHVEYFIIKDDKIGRAFCRRLAEKARQGIEVRIIYDGVGSWKVDFNREFFEELIQAGAEVQCFVPIKIPFLNSKINYRNHRKIIVIDGRVGFVGGINIGDEYLGQHVKHGFWRDTHLELRGDAVYTLQRIFLEDWYFVSKQKLMEKCYFTNHNIKGNKLIQIAASGPDSDWDSIMQLYYSAMASAQEKVYIITPYFIPDDSIIMALKTAALSGVDVRIILPSRPDHHIVYWATHSYLGELLEAGVKIYKYKKGFVHAKVLLVDGVVGSVGTANMDIRSFQLNYEVNAFIYDDITAKRLEKDFMQDISDSRLISLEEYNSRPFFSKIKESGARLLSPLL
jgi:cardiolipin synthase